MSSGSLSRSEIDAKMSELDEKLDELRRDYEQFFVGSRDRPPRNKRKQVERLVRELEQTQVNNTSQQFRVRSLIQRFTSYKQKWNRIQREIEEGTYQPHQKRAKRRTGGEDEAETEEAEQSEDNVVEIEDDLGEVDLEGLEEELQELNEDGAFERKPETERMSESNDDNVERRRDEGGSEQSNRRRRPPTDGDGSNPEEKRHKIEKLQNKLGISSGGASDDDRGSSSRRRRKESDPSTDNRRQQSGSDETDDGSAQIRGAKRENLEKLRDKLDDGDSSKRRERADQADTGDRRGGGNGADRGGRRRRRPDRGGSSDDDSSSDDDDETREAILYDRLLDARRACGQPVEHLEFETVRRSMAWRRVQVAQGYDVDDVRFEVVIKDDKAYLQPQLPD